VHNASNTEVALCEREEASYIGNSREAREGGWLGERKVKGEMGRLVRWMG
jgi:hypothetical protein